MNNNDNNNNDFSDDRSFMQRYGFAVGIGGVVLVAIAIFAGRQLFSGHSAPPRKNQEIVMIKMTPPPPPPPVQKPPEQVMKKEEMIVQDKVDKDEQKPDEQPKAAPISTGIKGNGPDSFGLSGGNGDGGIFSGRHGGSKWGWYAAQVQSRIEDALRANAKTRSAKIQMVVRIWVDPDTGRITRAELSGGTGDPALEDAIKNEVLTGLQLQEPPPKDMKMPINLRLTAQRPS